MRPVRAVLAALPLALLPVAPLAGQPDAVVARPAGAVRPTAPSSLAARAAVARRRGPDREVVAWWVPIVLPLGGALMGAASAEDACFGDGGKMAGRALLSGYALTFPTLLALGEVPPVLYEPHGGPGGGRAGMRLAPAAAPLTGGVVDDAGRGGGARWAFALPAAGAAIGAVVGTPIGAISGARHPERCGGGIGGGVAKGAGRMAVGGALVGAGLLALHGLSVVLPDDAGASPSAEALARQAGIRLDTLPGVQRPEVNLGLSLLAPGAGQARAGAHRRALVTAAIGVVAATTLATAPLSCSRGDDPACSRRQVNHANVAIVGFAATWLLAAADAERTTERRNRAVLARAIAERR